MNDYVLKQYVYSNSNGIILLKCYEDVRSTSEYIIISTPILGVDSNKEEERNELINPPIQRLQVPKDDQESVLVDLYRYQRIPL